MSNPDDEIAIRKGHQARQELRLTEEAFEALKANAMQKWADSNPAEVEKREECYRLIHVIAQVRKEMLGHIFAAEIAESTPSKG